MIINNILLQLKSEETVFINDLGTFCKQLISAKMVKGKMQPPKYKLVFNEETEGNGFNFILKLSKNEKLRITNADKQLRQWVTNLKQNLSENGSYTIEDFGTFSLLKNGKISFKCGDLSLLNQEFEGMEEVELPEAVVVKGVEEGVNKRKKVEKITEITKDKGVPEINRVEEEKKVEAVKETESVNRVEKEEKIEEKKKNSLWWLFMLVILLALALLFTLFREPIYKYTSTLKKKFIAYQQANAQQDKTAVTPVPDTIATTSPDTIIEPANNMKTVEPEAKPAVEPQTVTSNKLVTPPRKTERQPAAQVIITAEQISFQQGKFYLISGSFKSLQEAQTHINTSGLNKYHASILRQAGNDRCRVCVGIFDNEADAEQYRMLLKIPGWVLKE